MLLLFQCRKCGKFFCRSKHYTASVSNICCVKIITPCNINRQRILMIPCFIFYRNSEYACKDISYSPFNLISFILTQSMLKVKFLGYFKFMQIVAQTSFISKEGVAKSSDQMIERCPRSIHRKIRKESFCFGNPSGFLAYFNNASVFLTFQAVLAFTVRARERFSFCC